VSNPQHSKQPYPAENATACENFLQNNLTKLLRNNNTTAAAKSAAVSIPSIKELARDKTIHRMMSQAELDARRREMLLQAETIKRRYPPRIASQSTQAKAKPPAHAASW
jgi:hypothetical protein